MRRPVLALIGAIAALSAGTWAMAQPAVDPGAPNWNGVWVRVGSINWDPTLPQGELDHPPLTPEYQALYQRGLDSMAAGRPSNDPTAACAPPGMPRVMNMVYPMEIFQRPGQVAIFAEWQSQVRRIYTDGRAHPADLDPTYNGHSIGHWEGKDLVVDTVGLRGDMMLTMNGLGLSDALHVTERFRQLDDRTLTDTITLEDPKALTRAWTVTKTYRRSPETQIMEYVCEENNRNPIRPDGTTGVVLK
ncbi:MAG: hypothetical protein ACXU82_00715 [Caulobacteraceae bacterium]